MKLAVLLFDDFETLDVFGPVEIFGRLTDLYKIGFYSLEGGVVKNEHGVAILTEKLDTLQSADLFLLPGGHGTRKQVLNIRLIEEIKRLVDSCSYILTVCTGTSLLAQTGLLDGRRATSNKKAFEWVMSTGPRVLWNERARWVVDGKFYTSSGVSAGMDMSLSFLEEMHGTAFAQKVANDIEYIWIQDKDNDSFVAKTKKD